MEHSDCIILAVDAECNEADKGARDDEGGGATLLSSAESLVHVPRGRFPEPLWCLICLMANHSYLGFTFNQLSHFLRLV
jgi:hypothetical protein